MVKPVRLVATLGMAALLASAGIVWARPQAQPAAPATIPASLLFPQTQAVLDATVKAGKVPGVVVSIGVPNLPTFFLSSGRIADAATAAPAGPDSLWRVYSMTKPITAMAAMILIEQGKLKLDAPIATYLPAFAHMRVLTDPEHSLTSRPVTRPITVRNLLTHTAGLGYSIITTGPLLHEYERLGILPASLDAKSEAKARTVRPTSLAVFADRLATLPLIADPGTKWSYSIGLDLMGAVIEKVSGVPFDRFVTTRIFRPLGMTSSFWTVPAADVGRFADNYVALMGNRVPVDRGATSLWLTPPSFPYGGAGLVMSARDYDTFLHALQPGGPSVLKPETVALMTSDLLPPGVVFSGAVNGTAKDGDAAARQPAGYGAGGSVYTADGPGGYPGKGTYGWGGAAGTTAFIDPRRGTRVTVMLNLMNGVPGLREQLVAAMAADGRRLRGQ